MKRILSLLLLISTPIFTMNIDRSLVRSSDRLGEMGLSFDSEGFIVKNQGKKTRVHNYDVDKSLRGMNAQRLEAIKKAGAAIAVTKLSNGEFALRMNPNLNGGGPWLANLGYWATKTICYGTAAAGTTAVVVATGGAAGAAGGALAAISTATVATEVAVVGGAIAGAGLATEAAMTTTVVVANAGGITATMAAIEGAALSVSAFLLSLPTP